MTATSKDGTSKDKLIEQLKLIKPRWKMYFLHDGPVELYSYLYGFDLASETEYGGAVLKAIAKKKRTGSLVPTEKHISMEESIDIAIEVLTAAEGENNG